MRAQMDAVLDTSRKVDGAPTTLASLGFDWISMDDGQVCTTAQLTTLDGERQRTENLQPNILLLGRGNHHPVSSSQILSPDFLKNFSTVMSLRRHACTHHAPCVGLIHCADFAIAYTGTCSCHRTSPNSCWTTTSIFYSFLEMRNVKGGKNATAQRGVHLTPPSQHAQSAKQAASDACSPAVQPPTRGSTLDALPLPQHRGAAGMVRD